GDALHDRARSAGVGGEAEAEVGGGVAGLEAAAVGVAEEGRVVLEVGGAHAGAAAEEGAVGGAVGAGVGGDEGGVEVLDLLPHEAVEVPRAPRVAVGGADVREDGRAGRSEERRGGKEGGRQWSA